VEGRRGRMMVGINPPRYIASIYGNVTIKFPVQLIYAKMLKNK
jgi:hypothetical protein